MNKSKLAGPKVQVPVTNYGRIRDSKIPTPQFFQVPSSCNFDDPVNPGQFRQWLETCPSFGEFKLNLTLTLPLVQWIKLGEMVAVDKIPLDFLVSDLLNTTGIIENWKPGQFNYNEKEVAK